MRTIKEAEQLIIKLQQFNLGAAYIHDISFNIGLLRMYTIYGHKKWTQERTDKIFNRVEKFIEKLQSVEIRSVNVSK